MKEFEKSLERTGQSIQRWVYLGCAAMFAALFFYFKAQ